MRSLLVLVSLLVLSMSTLGCGESDTGLALMQDANKSNIQRLANLYRLYQSQNKWRGPKTVEDLKGFIENMPADRLNMYGVDANDIESLFISERDGEEFQFRFEVKGAPMLQTPVVFEQTGKDGSRLVGFTSLEPQEVSGSEFDDLWAGKFKSAKIQGPQ